MSKRFKTRSEKEAEKATLEAKIGLLHESFLGFFYYDPPNLLQCLPVTANENAREMETQARYVSVTYDTNRARLGLY